MGALSIIRNAVSRVFTKAQPMRAVDGGRGWTSLFSSGNWYADGDQDTFDWQRDIQKSDGGVLANWAIFACTTLISSDVGKLRMRLVELKDGIWTETTSAAFSPVLKKPNGYQTWQQFIEAWLVSKLTRGNAYIIKVRDNRGGENRGVVTEMHALNPDLVQPLVAPNGMVFYQLQRDELAGLKSEEGYPAVPASEVVHDRFNCLFHPLVGLPPIFACGLAAMQGLAIQKNSAKFFKNMSRPSGVLTAPAQISDITASRLKAEWEKNYSGDNMGKVAVLGDGLSYQAMAVTAVDAELVAQLKLSADMVCSTFHIPAFKIGAGTIPAGQKVGDLNQIYYADCLQALMEAIENLLDDGLGIGVSNPKDGRILGTEFDLDGLLKMDPTTLTSSLKEQTSAGIVKLDEARKRLNYAPMAGGDSAYLQQQNYSVQALAKRDASEDPFGTAKPPAPPEPTNPEDEAASKAAMVAQMAQHTTTAREALEGAIARAAEASAQGIAEARAALGQSASAETVLLAERARHVEELAQQRAIAQEQAAAVAQIGQRFAEMLAEQRKAVEVIEAEAARRAEQEAARTMREAAAEQTRAAEDAARLTAQAGAQEAIQRASTSAAEFAKALEANFLTRS